MFFHRDGVNHWLGDDVNHRIGDGVTWWLSDCQLLAWRW